MFVNVPSRRGIQLPLQTKLPRLDHYVSVRAHHDQDVRSTSHFREVANA